MTTTEEAKTPGQIAHDAAYNLPPDSQLWQGQTDGVRDFWNRAGAALAAALATPAPSSPGVPDSVRALLDRPLSSEQNRKYVSSLVSNDAYGEAIARVVTDAEVLHEIRTLLSAHPAGQSAPPEADPTLLYWIESNTDRLCKLYPEAADSIAEFRDELLGLMDGGPAGQGAELSSRIYKVLRDYGMSNMTDQDDGGAYPLVDLCTPDCRPINQGEDELRLIADEIAYALAPDSTRTGQVETVAVPASALRWLLGEGPDEDGVWFGDQIRGKGAFWWRSEFRRRIEAARPAAPEAQGAERVRHVKRGTEYEVMGEAEAQVSVGQTVYANVPEGAYVFREVKDGDRLTVYRGPDGKLWCRFTDEFRDGRFVPASSGQESA